MEELRPPLLPQPPGLEPGPLGPASQSESDPSERSLCRELVSHSIDNSFASGSSDDGVPVAPSRFLKMQDSVKRNVRSGFRLHPRIAKSEASILFELSTKSTRELVVEPPMTVGLSFCAVAVYDVPCD